MDALDEFGDLLSVPIPENRSYHTVAGLVLQHFGVPPSVADKLDYQGWHFEIVDLDGRRIDKSRRAIRWMATRPAPKPR